VPFEVNLVLTAAEKLRRGVCLELCCDDACSVQKLLIVKEVRRQAPGCFAKEHAA